MQKNGSVACPAIVPNYLFLLLLTGKAPGSSLDVIGPAYLNPFALRTAKTLWSFGHSECSRVKNAFFIVIFNRIIVTYLKKKKRFFTNVNSTPFLSVDLSIHFFWVRPFLVLEVSNWMIIKYICP